VSQSAHIQSDYATPQVAFHLARATRLDATTASPLESLLNEGMASSKAQSMNKRVPRQAHWFSGSFVAARTRQL